MRGLANIALLGALTAACTAPDSRDSVPDARLQDGALIHYEVAGPDGLEALVLIHGWASSTAAWGHQFPAFGERARVLAVDLVGHGQSDAPDVPLTMARMADSVAAAMDHAGVERAVLIGHSNGVPVAQTFCRRYPERTLAIVGIDGALKPMFDRAAFDGFFAPFRGDDWRAAMSGMIDAMAAPGLSGEDLEVIREMALATPHASVVGGAESVLDPEAWTDEPIDVPLLLVLAAQPTWSPAYAEYVRGRAPGVDYRVWEGVGHYIQMERPAELRAALEEFLDAYGLL